MGRVLERGAYHDLLRGDMKELGFKYQVRMEYVFELDHNYGTFEVHHQRYDLPRREEPFFIVRGNILIVRPGYHWNGCSGPTRDTAGNMAPGLAHDCLYQAGRLRYLDLSYRKLADEDFRELLASEGWGQSKWMVGRLWGRFRKRGYYRSVRVFGKGSMAPKVPEGWNGGI